MAEKPKAPIAGHVCAVCEEAIDVLDMVIAVISVMWSIPDADLPQLGRHLKFHRTCAPAFVNTWNAENAYGRTSPLV
jgi:hypothetical protein